MKSKKENFWQKLEKPIMALAPLADVTDAAFRRIIAKYGKPDVMFTEFTSADGLCSPEGKKALMVNLKFTAKERPIVAQLFSANPEKMREAAKLVAKLGFDGLDINMGCPDRKVEKGGAGAALMKNQKLAREIIRAAIDGASGLPVSVKTRLGYNKDELDIWLSQILSEDVSAVTVHARTRKEMSAVPARWERVKRAVEIRDKMKSKAFIIGNGDVLDIADARKKIKETGADGVMLGRAIFGTPWLFNKNQKKSVTKEQKLKIMAEHAKLFEKIFGRKNPSTTSHTGSRFARQGTPLFGTRPRPGDGAGLISANHSLPLLKGKLRADIKNFSIMKKHFKAYANGFPGAKELRIKLMETNNSKEVVRIVTDLLKRKSL